MHEEPVTAAGGGALRRTPRRAAPGDTAEAGCLPSLQRNAGSPCRRETCSPGRERAPRSPAGRSATQRGASARTELPPRRQRGAGGLPDGSREDARPPAPSGWASRVLGVTRGAPSGFKARIGASPQKTPCPQHVPLQGLRTPPQAQARHLQWAHPPGSWLGTWGLRRG